MSKPVFFIVWSDGVEHRFNTRCSARLFAASQRIMGKKVIFKAVGF